MSGDELIGITVASGKLIRGLFEADDNEKTDSGWSSICPRSVEQKQTLYNAAPNHPQAVIDNPLKPAHYKMFSGPKGDYLFSERGVPVKLAINNPSPGLELIVMARYKALTHQDNAVQACHEHSIMTPAESHGMELRTPNKAAFVLMAGYSRPPAVYDFEGGHPIARVPLNSDAERDELNLVFPCLSSCKPHKDCGSLILFHLDIRDINSGVIVSSYEFTARVARNVLARASNKYEEDMLGKSTPRRPAKRPMPFQGGEGLGDAAEGVEVVAKHPKREHGDERNDHASDVRVVIVNPEFNHDGEERSNASGGRDIGADLTEAEYDASDVKDMADYILNCDLFAKKAVHRMLADIQAGASSSTLAADDDGNIRNGTDSASNQTTLIEASHSSNKSMVNIGASSGSSLGMACIDHLPSQMVNNQTSMVPIANNSSLTVVNQNQISPEGCSLSSSTSLDCSNNPPGSLQEYAISNTVAFIVTNLKNPESDCHKIKQCIESLGALCSQVPVFNQIFPT